MRLTRGADGDRIDVRRLDELVDRGLDLQFRGDLRRRVGERVSHRHDASPGYLTSQDRGVHPADPTDASDTHPDGPHLASLSTDARLRARVGALVDRLSTADSSSGSGAVDLALTVCVVEVLVQGEGQATGAVRLVEHWYRHHIAIIVAERLAGTEEVTGPLLAIAHGRLAPRRAVVAAQQSDPANWTALTVVL